MYSTHAVEGIRNHKKLMISFNFQRNYTDIKSRVENLKRLRHLVIIIHSITCKLMILMFDFLNIEVLSIAKIIFCIFIVIFQNLFVTSFNFPGRHSLEFGRSLLWI